MPSSTRKEVKSCQLAFFCALGGMLVCLVLTGCQPGIQDGVITEATGQSDPYCDGKYEICLEAAEEFRSHHKNGELTSSGLDDAFSVLEEIRCFGQFEKGQAPKAAERSGYIWRKGEVSQIMRLRLNAKCITSVYSEDEVADWAGKGDPVASYAHAHNILRRRGCAGFEEAKGWLSKSLAHMSPIENDTVLRVPEAGYAVGAVAIYCLEKEDAIDTYSDYVSRAEMGGLASRRYLL